MFTDVDVQDDGLEIFKAAKRSVRGGLGFMGQTIQAMTFMKKAGGSHGSATSIAREKNAFPLLFFHTRCSTSWVLRLLTSGNGRFLIYLHHEHLEFACDSPFCKEHSQ